MATWTHVKTGGIYTDEEAALLQIDGYWVDCMIYRKGDKKFVRTTDDFYESMKLIEED